MNLLMFFVLLFNQNFENYNGIVQIVDGESVYNGVNISDGVILTTASHGVSDFMTAVFHGENGKSFKTQAFVQKIDTENNLCLLSYTKPVYISGSISIYPIRDKFFTKVDIIGWGAKNAYFSFVNQIPSRTINIGSYNYNFSGLAMINEGSLVGLQVYKSDRNIYWVSAGVIKNFLEVSK